MAANNPGDLARQLVRRRRMIATAVAAERGRRRRPSSASVLLPLADIDGHIAALAVALRFARPDLFGSHAAWSKVTLAARGVPPEDLAADLVALRSQLSRLLPGEDGAVAARYVGQAIAELPSHPVVPPPVLDETWPPHALAAGYLADLLRGDRAAAIRRVAEAAGGDGVSLGHLYVEALQPALRELGRLWHIGRITEGEEHFCSAATHLAIAQFYYRIAFVPKSGRRAIVASVAGERHDIGGRMVADLLELAGWDVRFLGPDMPLSGLFSLMVAVRPQALGLSVTLAHNLHSAQETIAAVRARPALRDVRIVVGGAVLLDHPDLWRQLGADAMADDADRAVAVFAEG